MMKVLVAMDESEESLNALSWALDRLFTRIGAGVALDTSEEEGDELIILHVLQQLHHFIVPIGPGAVYASPAAFESARNALQHKAEFVLSRAEQICREKLVSSKTVTMEGEPKETICQAVEKMDADLLVVGSRGLGKIKRAVLGSVSDYCAHHAKCPVLIVKPPK